MRWPLRWVKKSGDVCNAVACSAPLKIAERPPHLPPIKSGVDLSPRGGERGKSDPVFAARRARESRAHNVKQPIFAP